MLDLTHLISQIEQTFSPVAILLYGSLTRGDYNENSDIDLMIICHETEEKAYNTMFQERYVDAFVKPLCLFSPENAEQFLHLDKAHILKDHNEYFKNYLSILSEVKQTPPSPLSQHEKDHIIMWCNKTIERAKLGNHEGLYRQHWLLFELLEHYFKFRTIRYEGPKLAFHYLEKHDPELYNLFDQCMKNHKEFNSLSKLVKLTLQLS